MVTRAARKLKLNDTNEDDVPQERMEVSSSSSFSPSRKSPFRKSPPSPAVVRSGLDSELPARKQLFPTSSGSNALLKLSRLKYSSTKKLISSKMGGQSPFDLLDHSQKFVSETDSDSKKTFMLTRSTEADTLQSEESLVLSQVSDENLEDASCSQSERTDTGGGSFNYLTSNDLITTYRGPLGVDDKMTSSQSSCSKSEQLSLARDATPLIDLVDNTCTQVTNHRASFLSSTNSSKVYT